MKIDPDSSCLRFIHQIDADDQLFTPRHQLQRKRQAPSKARRITDGDHAGIRMRMQILCCNAFLLRPGFQRVCARKIRHGICLRGIGICAVRYRDCLPGQFPRMLMQPGQRVENAALPTFGFPASAMARSTGSFRLI